MRGVLWYPEGFPPNNFKKRDKKKIKRVIKEHLPELINRFNIYSYYIGPEYDIFNVPIHKRYGLICITVSHPNPGKSIPHYFYGVPIKFIIKPLNN